MRALIIFSGMALLAFMSSKAANGFENQRFLQSVAAEDPGDMVVSGGGRTVEESIAEDKLITEYKEVSYRPVTVDRTMEYRIGEDNQIIENNKSFEFYLLDFQKINRSGNQVKNSKQKAKIPIFIHL